MHEGTQGRSSNKDSLLLLPVFILLAGLAATGLTAYSIQQNIEARNRVHFLEAVHQIEQTVQTRMEAYIGLLRGGAGLFAASPLVTLREFRRFYERLEIERNYPGVQGFGYSVHFPADRLGAILDRVRREGVTGFDIWPGASADGYDAIVFLEPQDDRNRKALGYNMFTEPVRAAAMAAARDSGRPVASGKVKLVQEIRGPEQPGFLLYLPVYLGGEVPQTLDERRAKIQGYVYSPFRAGDLFSAIVPSHLAPGLRFEIYDGPKVSPNALLYESAPGEKRGGAPQHREIEIAGRVWTLEFVPLPGSEDAPGSGVVWVIPLLGAMATLLLVYFAWTEGKARKKSEDTARALAESEELHRAIAETAADGIAVMDEHGRMLTVNPAVENIFGYSADELTGEIFSKLLPNRMQQRHRENLEQFIATAEKPASWSGMEMIGLHRDGREVPLEVSIGVARREGKYLFTVLIRDVTRRKESEQLLHETEERFALLVRLAEEYAIITMGPNGEITTWNPGAERTFGYGDAEVIGRDNGIFFTAEERAEGVPGRQLAAARSSGRVMDERWQVRKDGSRFWATGSLIALKTEDGKLRGFAKILRDITERKKAEESVRELNQELEMRVQRRTAALQESKEQMEAFTYTVAHDLRAPLRAMQGFAHALSEDYQTALDETARDYLERIMHSAQRMDELIQDLLAYSRLSQSELTFQAVRVREVIASALADQRAEIEAREARVEIIAEESLLVEAHLATLQHALSNLVGNALKFVKAGEKPFVQIRAIDQADKVQISVQDRGIGIAPEHQNRIFRVFERLHSQDAYPGTGIGLAIVKKGIERMGGRLGLVSEAGEGSLFWIELPKAPPPREI